MELDYRLVLDGLSDAVVASDRSNRITYLNAAVERLLGWRREELLGQPLTILMPVRMHSAHEEGFRRFIETHQTRIIGKPIRVPALHRDGTELDIELTLTALRVGSEDLIVASMRDVRERIELERQQQRDAARARSQVLSIEDRYRFLVDSVKDYSIFMLDPEGRVATWNSGAQRMKGYSPQEIIGQHFSVFCLPEDVEKGKPDRELQAALAEGRIEEEGWRVRKDGSRFWANVAISAIHDEKGKHLGFAKVTRDLTEAREAEQARIGRAQAEEAVRLRDEFLAVASHELKTPLHAVKLQLELVGRALAALGPGALQRIAPKIQSMHRQVDQLAVLTTGLLDLSTIRTGKPAVSPSVLDVEGAIRSAVEKIASELAQAQCEVRLTLEAGLSAMLDAARFDRVLLNILSNAAKYGTGRPIDVGLHGEGSRVTVTVTDHGIGISPENLDRIFGKFERAVSAENYGGWGLGLFIARQLVEAMGGTIEAHSTLGQGATFKVQFERVFSPAPENRQ